MVIGYGSHITVQDYVFFLLKIEIDINDRA
jgi:hypothetical protein